MVEPVTVNKALIIPNTCNLPGTWGSAALNPDFVALDGMLGGFTTISLTNVNVTLDVPSGFVATPGAGPTQSQNGMITFSGTLTGNVIITFPMPGYYIVENLCVVGAFYVKLASNAPGNVICAPPGEAVHIFNDGVNMRYVNLGRVGSYLDLAVSSTPVWITNCTVPPYLNCNGGTFSAVTYPVLAAQLGGTTLPDSRGRSRFTLNQTVSRVTTAVSGVDGNTLLAAGGDQATQQHTHVVTDPGHNHVSASGNTQFLINDAATAQFNTTGGTRGTFSAIAAAQTGVTLQNYGTGAAQNMPPAYMGGITLIRAG